MPKGLATAAVDRLLHEAHVIVTEDSLQRLAEAPAGKGVEASSLELPDVAISPDFWWP